MTTTELTAEDLPLLTTVVEEAPDDLPTLTEVVDAMPPFIPPSVETPMAMEGELPALMEAVTTKPSDTPETEIAESAATLPALSEADMQRLAVQLEAHLETVFAQKLGHRLEQLQRLAVDQAVRELKAELPRMLHDALHSPGSNS